MPLRRIVFTGYLMKKKFSALSLAVLLFITITPLHAENLVQVYQQALASDPTFKKAHSDWLSLQQNLPLAISGNGSPGSGLLPYLDLTAGLGRTYQRVSIGSADADGYFNQNNYLVTITQQIFNYSTWKAISGARFTVKSATATYLAAAQDLMFRTAQAYFNVLNAYDQLQYKIG